MSGNTNGFMPEEFKTLPQEERIRQNQEAKAFVVRYLQDLTPEKVDVHSKYGLNSICVYDAFCNNDAVCAEWFDGLPVNAIRIYGHVSRNKSIDEYCYTKEQVKAAIDTLVLQALKLKSHKCSEPKLIEYYDEPDEEEQIDK